MAARKSVESLHSNRYFRIEDFAAKNPQRADAFRELFAYFEARSFLPTLHDVNWFLHRLSTTQATRLRTRASAPAAVFQALANLPDEGFTGILEGARLRAAGKSDLAIVGEAILGTPAMDE